MNAIPEPSYRNVADLLAQLAVPPQRIRLHPLPGCATEADAARHKFCELIDGVLVEKATGFYESRLAFVLIGFLNDYLKTQDRGIGLDGSGLIRVGVNQLRLPDVSFFAWEHFPGRKLPAGQVLDIVPDLAVEILSPSNTRAEMVRKRSEYSAGGAQLVWQVDPVQRTVEVFTAAAESTLCDESATLDGDTVLPGFTLLIRTWFAQAGQRAEE